MNKNNTKLYLDIKNKKQYMNYIKEKIKKNFYGLDLVIDNIFYKLSSWFLFHDKLNKPTVINLWGITGTGKTEFVRQLVQELKLYDNYLEISLTNSKVLENNYTSITEQLMELNSNAMSDNKNKFILLLDDIHNFRTKNVSGNEIYNEKYSDIWSIICGGESFSCSSIMNNLNNIKRSCIKKLEIEFNIVRNRNNYVKKQLMDIIARVERLNENDKSYIFNSLPLLYNILYSNEQIDNIKRYQLLNKLISMKNSEEKNKLEQLLSVYVNIRGTTSDDDNNEDVIYSLYDKGTSSWSWGYRNTNESNEYKNLFKNFLFSAKPNPYILKEILYIKTLALNKNSTLILNCLNKNSYVCQLYINMLNKLNIIDDRYWDSLVEAAFAVDINIINKLNKYLINENYEDFIKNLSILDLLILVEDHFQKIKNDNTKLNIKINRYSNFLIFTTGNLDNLQHNPYSGKSINEIKDLSSNINMEEIKNALNHLFKPEQVSRLGYNHIIFETIGEDNCKKYIKQNTLDTIYSTFESLNIKINDYKIIIRDEYYDYILNDSGWDTRSGIRALYSLIMAIYSRLNERIIDEIYINNNKILHFDDINEKTFIIIESNKGE